MTKEVYGDIEKVRTLCETTKLLLIRDVENEEAFKAFVTLILPPVVRKIRFRNLKCHKPLSSFVSVPDEAFALLILENNFQKWEAYVQKKVRDDEPDGGEDEGGGQSYEDPKKMKTRYGKEKKNWSTHRLAIERYNKFVKMVIEKRLGNGQQNIEKNIVEDFLRMQGEKPPQQCMKRRFYEDGEDGDDSSNELNDDVVAEKPIDSFL